jgi:hypothetical protein
MASTQTTADDLVDLIELINARSKIEDHTTLAKVIDYMHRNVNTPDDQIAEVTHGDLRAMLHGGYVRFIRVDIPAGGRDIGQPEPCPVCGSRTSCSHVARVWP